MANTQDDITRMSNLLNGLGEDAENMSSFLNRIGQDIVAELKLNYTAVGLHIRSTNGLYNSISATATNTTLILGMRDYGFYNNYGVMPTPSYKNGGTSPYQTPDGHTFRYSSRRKFGLPSRQFFDIDSMEEEIAERLLEELTIPFN